MKIAVTLLLIVLAVLACGCTAQAPAAAPQAAPAASPTVQAYTSTPDLVGRWVGTSVGHAQNSGFWEWPATVFNITVQKGQAFYGAKEYTNKDGKIYYENFSGVITPKGELYMADNMKGKTFGTLTGPDTLELVNIEDGADTKAYYMLLTRQKN